MTFHRTLASAISIMAAYFGEILEPVSRALFDDFSDEEEDIRDIKLQYTSYTWLQKNIIVPSNLDFFFVIHGKLNLAFTEAYLLDDSSNLVAEISISKSKHDDDFSNDEKLLPCRLYLQENTMICLISPSFSNNTSFQLTEVLSKSLQTSKNVIILTSESVYSYKTDAFDKLPPAFIRELKTSKGNHKNCAEPLLVPNMISGIPAAVASWCEIFGIPASVFICFSDQEVLDSVTASPLLSLFHSLPHHLIKTEQPRNSKLWFYGTPKPVGGISNIYI